MNAAESLRMMPTKCFECKMLTEHCVCGRLPRVESSVRIVIIRHVAEQHKASNTGRILHKMLVNSALLTFGAFNEPFDPSELKRPGVRTEVLYPCTKARILGASQPDGSDSPADQSTPMERVLVVLDASWSQARRMRRRVPGVLGLSQVTMSGGPPPRWDVRVSKRPYHYCTLETVVRAFETLGETDAAAALAVGQEIVRQRLLCARGRMRKREMSPW